VAIATLFLPSIDATDQELKDSEGWRYFVAFPIVLCAIFIVGFFIFIRHDTPMYLVSQDRFDEAKVAIKHFSASNED
jgi:hypothetical protein